MSPVLYFQLMEQLTIERTGYLLRSWVPEDAVSLVKHANNPNVANNLRDGFPYPYTLRDAKQWLESVNENSDNIIMALEINGEAAGGIGLHGQKDVYRFNVEIGYWLSERYWGKGIMTDAVSATVEHAFTRTSWLRIFANIYEHNYSSMRVLEKCGFRKEAIHKKAVIKNNKLLDEHLYALLKENWTSMNK